MIKLCLSILKLERCLLVREELREILSNDSVHKNFTNKWVLQRPKNVKQIMCLFIYMPDLTSCLPTGHFWPPVVLR